MIVRITKIFLVMFVLVAIGACSSTGSKQEASLYDRLGGKEAITMVINDFVNTVGSDPRITNEKVTKRLQAIDIDQLKAYLVEQVCVGTGGPCKYTGRSMKEAHAGLEISNADFDVVVDDLVKTLDKYNVPEKEKGELLSILGPMRPDIVEVK